MSRADLFFCAVFRIVLDKMDLLGRVDPKQAKEKWDSLKKKYKVDNVNCRFEWWWCGHELLYSILLIQVLLQHIKPTTSSKSNYLLDLLEVQRCGTPPVLLKKMARNLLFIIPKARSMTERALEWRALKRWASTPWTGCLYGVAVCKEEVSWRRVGSLLIQCAVPEFSGSMHRPWPAHIGVRKSGHKLPACEQRHTASCSRSSDHKGHHLLSNSIDHLLGWWSEAFQKLLQPPCTMHH